VGASAARMRGVPPMLDIPWFAMKLQFTLLDPLDPAGATG